MQSQTRAAAGPTARVRWRGGATVCGLLTVALSACGASSAGKNEPNNARLAPAIELSGTLTLSTPFALVARFTDDISTAATAGLTCADAAKGFLQDGVRYEPPHNPQGSTFDTLDGQHHTVTITLHISGYNGPATYGKPNISGDDGLQLLKVDGYSYGTFLGGDVSAHVMPDDSGQLSFAGLALTPPTPAAATPTPSHTPPPTAKPTPQPAVKPLTGTLTWTCVQLRAPTPTPAPRRAPGSAPAAPAGSQTPTPTPKR